MTMQFGNLGIHAITTICSCWANDVSKSTRHDKKQWSIKQTIKK